MRHLLCGALLALALTAPCAADIVVNSSSGARDVGGACALRDAIRAVNTMQPVGGCPPGRATETIVLEVASVELTGPDPDSDNAALPEIASLRTLTITSRPGFPAVIRRIPAQPCTPDGVTGPDEFRLLEVRGGLTLSNLSLDGGCADGPSGSARANGGVVLNRGGVTLDRVVVRGGVARTYGGGIMNLPIAGLGLYESTLEYNAAVSGAGIFNDHGNVYFAHSLARGNRVFADPDGTRPSIGNVLDNRGTARFLNSTLTGQFSGGIVEAGTIGSVDDADPAPATTLRLEFTTLAFNQGTGLNLGTRSIVTLANSIVTTGIGGCVGLAPARTTRHGRNVFTDVNCRDPAYAGDILANPQLMPLANYGGPTLTMMPLAGSPVTDRAVPCTNGSAVVEYDQRDALRPEDGVCDIGAVERPGGGLLSDSFE